MNDNQAAAAANPDKPRGAGNGSGELADQAGSGPARRRVRRPKVADGVTTTSSRSRRRAPRNGRGGTTPSDAATAAPEQDEGTARVRRRNPRQGAASTTPTGGTAPARRRGGASGPAGGTSKASSPGRGASGAARAAGTAKGGPGSTSSPSTGASSTGAANGGPAARAASKNTAGKNTGAKNTGAKNTGAKSTATKNTASKRAAAKGGAVQGGSKRVTPKGTGSGSTSKGAAAKRGVAKRGGASRPGGRGPGERVEGSLRLHARGFGFVERAEGEDLFCPPELARTAMDGDVVAGELRGDRMVSLEVVERRRTEVVGTVVKVDGAKRLELDDHIGSGELELVGRCEVGQTVVARLDGGRAVVVERYQGFEDSMRARVLVRACLPRDMAPPAADARCDELLAGSRRRDLRDMVTLTIDDQHSMDLDDALSVVPADADGCIRLLVHISDVAEHVAVGSVADEAAREVATSIYLHPWVRPMLARTLSEDTLSLVPDVERDTLTVELRVDPEGEVLAVDIFESRTVSNGRIDYQLASKVLREEEGVDVAAEMVETLRWLRTVSARLGSARQRRGGLAARLVEPELRGQGEARDLIERCMVAANEAVARWMAERGLPGLWRVHDAPGAEEIAELEELTGRLGFHAGFGKVVTPRSMAALDAQISGGDERTQGLWHATLERLSRARYTAEPGGHFGLGSESYTHFTSPIRRYADLAVHRVVKAHLRGEAQGGTDMAALAEHINVQAGRAARAESQLRSSRRLQLLAERKGWCDGWVTAARESSVRVWLDVGVRAHLPMRAMKGHWAKEGVCVVGPNGRRICPGERIRVKVVRLDVDNGVVEVAMQ